MVQVVATIKQGVTFRAGLTASRDGSPINVTSVPIASAVVTADGSFRFDLTVVKTNPVSGKFEVSGASATWPEDTVLLWDVVVSEVNNVWATPTRGIKVDEKVT